MEEIMFTEKTDLALSEHTQFFLYSKVFPELMVSWIFWHAQQQSFVTCKRRRDIEVTVYFGRS